MSPPRKSPQYVGLQIVTRMERAGTRGRSGSAPGATWEASGTVRRTPAPLQSCAARRPESQLSQGSAFTEGYLPPSTPSPSEGLGFCLLLWAPELYSSLGIFGQKINKVTSCFLSLINTVNDDEHTLKTTSFPFTHQDRAYQLMRMGSGHCKHLL